MLGQQQLNEGIRLAVEPAIEDGAYHGIVHLRSSSQASTGGLEPLRAVLIGELQDPQAGVVVLLAGLASFQDSSYGRLRGGLDAGGPAKEVVGVPAPRLGVVQVFGRHVVVQGGITLCHMAPSMEGDALMVPIDLHMVDVADDTHHAAYEGEGYAVPVPLGVLPGYGSRAPPSRWRWSWGRRRGRAGA